VSNFPVDIVNSGGLVGGGNVGVSDADFPSGTYVVSGAGTATLTLSQNATASGTAVATSFSGVPGVTSVASGQTGAVLLVDAANVVGSRPTGWWRDRAGAARGFVEQLRAAARAGRLRPPVVVVLEGQARAGVPAGALDGVEVLHASGSGDELLLDVTSGASEPVMLVTADRALRGRAEALGASVVGPAWLLSRLEET